MLTRIPNRILLEILLVSTSNDLAQLAKFRIVCKGFKTSIDQLFDYVDMKSRFIKFGNWDLFKIEHLNQTLPMKDEKDLITYWDQYRIDFCVGYFATHPECQFILIRKDELNGISTFEIFDTISRKFVYSLEALYWFAAWVIPNEVFVCYFRVRDEPYFEIHKIKCSGSEFKLESFIKTTKLNSQYLKFVTKDDHLFIIQPDIFFNEVEIVNLKNPDQPICLPMKYDFVCEYQTWLFHINIQDGVVNSDSFGSTIYPYNRKNSNESLGDFVFISQNGNLSIYQQNKGWLVKDIQPLIEGSFIFKIENEFLKRFGMDTVKTKKPQQYVKVSKYATLFATRNTGINMYFPKK